MSTPTVAALTARLEELEQEHAKAQVRTQEEHARLKDEVAQLSAANLETHGWRRSQHSPNGESSDDADGARMSRSRFLRMGGAAAAGAVAAGASGLLSARPAAAATNDPLLIGRYNYPSAANDVTRLLGASNTQLSPSLFVVGNRGCANSWGESR